MGSVGFQDFHSLGDRACLALAIDRKATVYTTEKTWSKLDLGIRIEVIR